MVQLPRGNGGQAFGGERLSAADVPLQRVHEPRAELVRQGGFVPVGEKYKILAGSLQFADRAGGQGGAHIHQNAALQYIAAGQRQSAVNGQRCQHVQVIGCTAFVMVKGQNLGVRLQGGIQVLQKQLFLCGAGVQGQIHRFNQGAVQKSAACHLVHNAGQGIVPPGTGGAAQQHAAAGMGGIGGAHHKGAAERLDHLPHKGILPQHLLAHPVGQAIKVFRAGFYRFCCGGRLCGFAAQQAVLAQALGQLAAHAAHTVRGGGAGALHGVQGVRGRFLAFLAFGQSVQLGLHGVQAVLRGIAVLFGSAVAACTGHTSHPGIVLIFQAHGFALRYISRLFSR